MLREALGLWRGPPLAEFRYADFARDEIGRLEEMRLGAQEDRIQAELALGRDAETVSELEALIREHPLRERLRELLMLALYRRVARPTPWPPTRMPRTALVDELGLDPGHSLQELEKAILRHDPSLDPAPPRPARRLSRRVHPPQGNGHLPVHGHRGFDGAPQEPRIEVRGAARRPSPDPLRGSRGTRRARGRQPGRLVLLRVRTSECRGCGRRRRAARPGRACVARRQRGARPDGAAHRRAVGRKRQVPRAWCSPSGPNRGGRATAARCCSPTQRASWPTTCWPGVSIEDLGSYRLKDIDQPERLYQLDVDGLATAFPPPRAEKAPTRRRGTRMTLVGAGVAAVAVAAVLAITLGHSGSAHALARIDADSAGVIDPGDNHLVSEARRRQRPRKAGFRASGRSGSSTTTRAPSPGSTPSTGTAQDTIQVDADPTAVAVAGDSVWVANSGTRQVDRINPADPHGGSALAGGERPERHRGQSRSALGRRTGSTTP